MSQWQSQGYDKNSIVSSSSAIFINPGTSDYRLKSGAPAIDRGLAAFNGVYASSTDISGIYCPQGRAHDIGAHESSYTIGGTADTVTPSITITTPTTASAYTAPSAILNLSGGASDNIGITQIAWSNSRGGSGTASGTTSWNVGSITLQSGSNVITVTARDAAGNTATDSLTVTYNVADTTSPTISITTPSNGTSYSTTASSVTLTGAASDNISITQITWSNNRGGSGTASGTTSWNTGNITLQSGSKLITVDARDAAGNISSDTLTVTYSTTAPGDTTAPGVTISSPTSSAAYTTSSGTMSLGGSASDNVGVTQVAWSNNRGGSGTASGTTSWSVGSITLQSGSNVITVTARDAANNQNTDVLTVTYNVADTTNPTVTITSPTSGTSYTASSGTLSLGGTASDNVGVTQVTWSNSLGGSGTASGTTSWNVSGIALQNGTNTITVTARDAAGNTAVDTLTVTYTTSTSQACSSSTVLCVDDTAGANQEYSTIQAAVNVVRPGDTILVHDGNYSGFSISADGTASSRIAIKAQGSSAVINQANSSGEGITLSNSHYVTVEGFAVTGMSGYGLATHNASATSPIRGLIIRNNRVQNSGSTNIYLSQVADSLIEGNVTSGSATSHGIYLANGGSDNTVLRGNRCYNNAKNGIHFNGDSSVGGDGLHTGITVDGNILYDNTANGVDADGVQDSVFQNNLMYGNGRNGIRVFQIDAAQGPKNLKFINNTLLVPSGGGWAVKLSEDLGGHVFFNNILLSDNGSTGSISVASTSFVSNNNALVGRLSFNGESSILGLAAWLAAGYDANSFITTSSSLFVNASTDDYRLKAGAPAINAGRTSLSGVSGPSTDILGAARPQGMAFDLGAYESSY